MRIVLLFFLVCLCTVVVLANHDHDRSKHHKDHDHDKRHREMKHGVSKKGQSHHRGHGQNGRHHGNHQKHLGEARHGHHVAKKAHASLSGHDNKRHHDLRHAEHLKRVGSGNETTTTPPPPATTEIVVNGTVLDGIGNSSNSSTPNINDITGDGESPDDDEGADYVSPDTDTTPECTSTRPPPIGPIGPILPVPPLIFPPIGWIENITNEISDRFRCIRRLRSNLTAAIAANLGRNPQEARNVSLIINGRVIYNVSVQVGITCPSLDDDPDSTLSIGIISPALHQASCVGSLVRNVTVQILRDVIRNPAAPRNIILSIDNQTVFDVTLDLTQRICIKPGSQQRSALLHYRTGFPANVNGAYPIKRSSLSAVARRVYDHVDGLHPKYG